MFLWLNCYSAVIVRGFFCLHWFDADEWHRQCAREDGSGLSHRHVLQRQLFPLWVIVSQGDLWSLASRFQPSLAVNMQVSCEALMRWMFDVTELYATRWNNSSLIRLCRPSCWRSSHVQCTWFSSGTSREFEHCPEMGLFSWMCARICVCVCVVRLKTSSKAGGEDLVRRWIQWLNRGGYMVPLMSAPNAQQPLNSSERITFSLSFFFRLFPERKKKHTRDVMKPDTQRPRCKFITADAIKHVCTHQTSGLPSTARRWHSQLRCPSPVSAAVSEPAGRTGPACRPNLSHSASIHLQEAEGWNGEREKKRGRRRWRLMAVFVGISALFSSWMVPPGQVSALH